MTAITSFIMACVLAMFIIVASVFGVALAIVLTTTLCVVVVIALALAGYGVIQYVLHILIPDDLHPNEADNG